MAQPFISRRRTFILLLLVGLGAIALGLGADYIMLGNRPRIGFRQLTLIISGFVVLVLSIIADLTIGERYTVGWCRRLNSGDRNLGRFLAILAQLGLLVFVADMYRLENQAFYRDIMLITLSGFFIHFFLPIRYRMIFFLFLSVIAIFRVFGLQNGAWLIGIGLVLVGICQLPLSYWIRVAIVLLAGGSLAAMRMEWVESPWSIGIWPILASMFMFRMIIYLYDIRHRREKMSLPSTLSYFFLLPNVVFPFFPAVDCSTFCRTYYDEERFRIYQRGVEWMFRGITQLILYRFVYYYLVISPEEAATVGDLTRFLVTNYMLYLRISGQFHMIVGILHLFGFNLPETNHRYFLASSFSDVWRRINIYWKDFIQKVFFYPAYFKLRRFGNETALILSTFIAFFATWFLHAYQWFWLRGSFLLSPQDALFWTILSMLVAANLVYESRFGRSRRLGRPAWSFGGAVSVTLRTAGTFAAMCVLWSFWTSGSFSEWISLWSVSDLALEESPYLVPLVIGFAVVVGSGMRGNGSAIAPGRSTEPTRFYRSALRNGLLILLVALLGTPQVYRSLGEDVRKVVRDLKVDKLSDRDSTLMVRGYYEGLTHINHFNSKLWEIYQGAPLARENLWKLGVLRLTGDFLHDELIPSLSTVYLDKPFKLNRFGMRDREYELGKPPGTYRIALLGASVAMGWGVGDGEAFESVLEDRMNRETAEHSLQRYEILNFSVGGYNPLQQVVVFEEKAIPFQPDAVFFTAHHKDDELSVHYLANCVKKGIEIPYPELRDIVSRAELHEGLSVDLLRKRINPFVDEITLWVYRRIAGGCRERGILPVWIFLPPVRSDFGLEKSAAIAHMAEESGYTVINLTEIFRDHDAAALRIAEWDRHPNADAHRIIADQLFIAIFGEGKIIPGNRLPDNKDKEAENGSMEETKETVKTFILKQFLPGVSPDELTDATPLITGGILDSLATLQLVTFLEEQYGIKIEAHEADVDHLNTISDIAELVRSKR